MKGLAGSARAMAVAALGLVPGGAIGKSLRQQPSEHRFGGVDTAGSPSRVKGSLSRHLQRSSSPPGPQVANDDALDVNGTVSVKTRSVYRTQLALSQKMCLFVTH
ncbi:unnamed protein product [Laminaria digitata]